MMQWEQERSGLLEAMERKQKLRIEAPQECEETLFRDMMVFENVVSEEGRTTCARR